MHKRTYPEKPEAVYYYGTCLADVLYPEAGMAGIRLLQREGMRVIYPRRQTCCGQPAYNSGYQQEAKAVAGKQVPLFPKNIPIVTPSGSCAAMMTRHYEDLFVNDPLSSSVKSFSGRVFELTEFLVHVLKVDWRDIGPPVTVAWHSSCHAKREMGVDSEPRQLLKQLENVKQVELNHKDECCGFGGTFSIKHSAISAEMVKDKCTHAAQSGAELLLSADCGCLMNIGGALEKTGSPLRTEHIATFLLRRTSGNAPE